jgi:hypothetical protein
MTEKNHFHFIIWAASDKVGDNFQGITYVDVIAADVKEAKSKAEKVCPGKRHYWVNNIVEHHGDHGKE